MDSSPRVIDVDINAQGATRGAASVNAALQSIADKCRGASSQIGGLSQEYVGLGGNAGKLSGQLQAANNNLGGTTRAAGQANGVVGALRQGMGQAASSAATLGGSASSLSSSLLGVGGIAGGVAAGILAIGAAAVGAAAQVQTMKASLTTVLGDAQQAGLAFDALAQFAAKTPFSMEQAINGFVEMRTLGLKPTEAALTAFGNVAAGKGQQLSQVIAAVADASTGEFERLKESFGITSKTMGDKVAFTFKGVTTTVGKNAAEIQAYLQKVGETDFAGGMENQSKTLAGAFSSLKDNIFLAFASLGDGALIDTISSVVNALASGVQTVTPLLDAIGNAFGSILSIAGELIGGIVNVWSAFSGGQSSVSMLDLLTATFNIIGQTASVVAGLIGAAFRGIASVVSWLVGMISGAWDWIMGKLGISTGQTMADVGNKFIGVLRAVKFVATVIPQLFAAAANAAARIFGDLGRRIGSFFSGNWGAFDGFAASAKAEFGKVDKMVGDTMSKAGQIIGDKKGNSAAWGRLTGRGGGPKSKIDDFAGGGVPGGSPSGAGGKKPGGAGGAGEKSPADKAADALKKYNELIQKLKEAADVAAIMPLEQEKYNRLLEGEKILKEGGVKNAKQLLDDLSKTLDIEIARKRLNEGLTDIKEKIRQNENEALVNGIRRVGLAGDEQKIEDEINKLKLEQLNKGNSLEAVTTGLIGQELERLRIILRQNAAFDAQTAKQKKILEDAQSYAKDAYEKANPRAAAKALMDERIAGLTSSRGSIPAEQFAAGIAQATKDYNDTMSKINDKFLDDMTGAIDQIAEGLGGKLGRTLSAFADALAQLAPGAAKSGLGGLFQGLGKLGSLFGGSGFDKGFGAGANRLSPDAIKSAFANPMRSFGDSINSLVGSFGKGGSFMQGLGNLMGGAMQGAGIGSAIAPFGQMLWKKFSGAGAQIGGALGSVFGPIGSVVGSILGGIGGGLLAKTKSGKAKIGVDPLTGELNIGSVKGNDDARKEQAQGVAQGIVDRVNGLAKSVGAWIDNMAYSLTVKKKSDYYINGVKYKKEEDAIAAGVRDAIKAGLVKGLSAFSTRALSGATGKTLDARLLAATGYEQVLKELIALQQGDGVAAMKSLNDEMSRLIQGMTQAGATVEELAKVNEYLAEASKRIISDALSSLRDFQKELNGEGSGIPGIGRLGTMLAEFQGFRDKITAGLTVDNDAFTTLGSEINSLALSLYGTTSTQYQDIRAMLLASTAGAITNTTNALTTTAAVQAQTVAITTNQVTQTGLLASILAAMTNARNGNSTGYAVSTSSGSNSARVAGTNGAYAWRMV